MTDLRIIRSKLGVRLLSLILMFSALGALVGIAAWREWGPGSGAARSPETVAAPASQRVAPPLPSGVGDAGFVVPWSPDEVRTTVSVRGDQAPEPHVPVIRRIMPEIDDRTPGGEFVRAAGGGDVATLRRLLGEGASPDVRDAMGRGALHKAAEAGSLDAVSALVEAGADLEEPDGTHWTPLTWAAGAGHPAVVEFLLARGAAVNPPHRPQVTPIGQVVFGWYIAETAPALPPGLVIEAKPEERLRVVRILFEAGADPNLMSSGELPLKHVPAIGNEELLSLFLDNGADVTLAPYLRAAASEPGPLADRLREAFRAADESSR